MVKKMYRNIFFIIYLIISIQPKKVEGFSKFTKTFAIVFSRSDTEH